MKKKRLENPVLHFTSATYKCEASVNRAFKLAASKQAGIHQLAVWTYKTNTPRELVIQMFCDELDRINSEKNR